jgi:hypothetical protein
MSHKHETDTDALKVDHSHYGKVNSLHKIGTRLFWTGDVEEIYCAKTLFQYTLIFLVMNV